MGAFKRGLEGGAHSLAWGGQGLLCGACTGEDVGRSGLLYATQATPGLGQFRGSGELQCLFAAWWGGVAHGFMPKHPPVQEAEGRLGAEISNLTGLVQAEELLEQLCISQMYEAVRGRRW